MFNVCPCFCVGEVLYFFTFHWLLLPLTFLWVTPHTAEPLWEFFPTLWSHNTTAWLQLCNIYEIPSTILKKNVSFQHLLSKFFLSNLVFLVNFLIYSSKGYVFFFMKFKTPSWFIRCAFIDTSFCFCFFFAQQFHANFWHHKIKVEIFLEPREVAFSSPSKICKNLNFSTVHV